MTNPPIQELVVIVENLSRAFNTIADKIISDERPV